MLFYNRILIYLIEIINLLEVFSYICVFFASFAGIFCVYYSIVS